MTEERLWIGGSSMYPESELDSCCRWTVYRSPREALRLALAGARESGEPVECKACGMHWHAEGFIRDYRCGCSIGPASALGEYTHLCKEANELELAMFEIASDYVMTVEFPKGFSKAEGDKKSGAEKQARRRFSEHFSTQAQAGRYRDIPERVLFAHPEPGAEGVNQ